MRLFIRFGGLFRAFRVAFDPLLFDILWLDLVAYDLVPRKGRSGGLYHEVLFIHALSYDFLPLFLGDRHVEEVAEL